VNRHRILTLVFLTLSGCGYSVGYDDTGAPGRRVAVDVAGNETFRQQLEIPLTRALVQVLPVYSNMRLSGHGDADRILKVDIEDVEGRALVRAGTTPVREGSLDYRVRARLIDARTGEVLKDEIVLDRAEFRIPVGETETSAAEEASFDLARKIVLALEEGF
jgi:hypothetical protein